MFCGKCDKEETDDNMFCMKCGFKFPQDVQNDDNIKIGAAGGSCF